jgi:hypothetical protein
LAWKWAGQAMFATVIGIKSTETSSCALVYTILVELALYEIK